MGSFAPVLMAHCHILSTVACSNTLLQNRHFTFLHHKLSCSIFSFPSAWKLLWYVPIKIQSNNKKWAGFHKHSSYLPISVIPHWETAQICQPYLPGENLGHFLPVLFWPHYKDFNHISSLIWAPLPIPLPNQLLMLLYPSVRCDRIDHFFLN